MGLPEARRIGSEMQAYRFDGRTAIITGAGGKPGLGRAHALLLASRGAKVVVNDIGARNDSRGYTSVASAEAVVDEIRAAGGTAVADTSSVATEQGAATLVQTALDAFGAVDIVINNAAVTAMAPFEVMTSRDIERHIQVNLMGPIWVCRAAWPHMKRRGYGRIVNVGSGAMTGLDHFVAYGVSKGGLYSLTRGLAIEGRESGIKVNQIHPWAHTRMLASIQEEDSVLLVQAREHAPAELVSPAVALLCHERCPVTGEVIAAGGGHVSRAFVAETKGLSFPQLTIEALAERWEEVVDEAVASAAPLAESNVASWKVKPYEG
jgi:NAD(P)-dependent dehydrogenase (short-subunit alcohol dehydrogenase family)